MQNYGVVLQNYGINLLGTGVGVQEMTGVVENLADGDTMTVRTKGGREHVRLLGIDAPELHYRSYSQSPWAEAALRQLRMLAPLGAQVRLITDREVRDKYRRLLAYVFRGQRNLNLEMLRSGWAVSYSIYPNVALLRQFQAATADAAAHKRGIFDARRPLPLLPYEFRHRVDNRPPDKFCGDSRTRRYVPPPDYQRVPVAWRVFFYTEAAARSFGFSPAAAPAFAEMPAPTPAAASPEGVPAPGAGPGGLMLQGDGGFAGGGRILRQVPVPAELGVPAGSLT